MKFTRAAIVAFVCCAASSFAADLSSSCREQVRGDGTLQTTESRRGRDRAQFHVVGERRGDTTKASLRFRDRVGGINLNTRNLTAFEVVDENTRRLTFTIPPADETQAAVDVVVTLRDLGRRGRSDFFELSAGDYLASGNLRGGNVRLKTKGCNDVINDGSGGDTGTDTGDVTP